MKAFDDLEWLIQITGEGSIERKNSGSFFLKDNQSLISLLTNLKNKEETFFDFLSCITAIDNHPFRPVIELVYSLYSIPHEHFLNLYIELPRINPEVESISSIWKSANWHEREAFDLFGIQFAHHPDLRRILLPNDWEGHPLRKDYQVQERYHGIGVDYKTEE